MRRANKVCEAADCSWSLLCGDGERCCSLIIYWQQSVQKKVKKMFVALNAMWDLSALVRWSLVLTSLWQVLNHTSIKQYGVLGPAGNEPLLSHLLTPLPTQLMGQDEDREGAHSAVTVMGKNQTQPGENTISLIWATLFYHQIRVG